MKDKYTFFWGTDGKYGHLSNWYKCKFKCELDIIEFNCSEQYMMYHKALLFKDNEIANLILKSDSPREQKKLGRKVKNFDTNIWEENAKKIVYDGCLLKYLSNPELMKKLFDTQGTILVEASPYDKVWGIGLLETDKRAKSKNKWLGKNWLGEVLTKLRNDLIKNNNNGKIFKK